MASPVELSTAQIAAFQALYDHNYRPVQPLNERTFLLASALAPSALPGAGGSGGAAGLSILASILPQMPVARTRLWLAHACGSHRTQKLREYLSHEGQFFCTQQLIEYQEETRSPQALAYDHTYPMWPTLPLLDLTNSSI